MNWLALLFALPSVLVAYMAVCRLNARKWRIWSPEAWAYLAFLGGAVYTFYTALSFGMMPSLGKYLMDAGACLYFANHSLRAHYLLKRRTRGGGKV